MKKVTPQEARDRLHHGGEIAFLDIREAGQFGEGHPLFAIPAPYSTLEIRIGALVPRRNAPILLIDGGDGVAERAAARLSALGYDSVSTVAGGTPGWLAAGLVLFQGVNVPSKTLGELAEHVWHPEMITAQDLAIWQEEQRDFGFYDSRPPQEYAKMRVPGAACLPNGELAHRLGAVARPGRPIVITCAGRTRGITGAIGLKALGHEGPVYALENGTQGWALAGHALERDNTADPFPDLSETHIALAAERAAALCARFDIATATAADIAGFLRDGSRTTYLFDVRSAPEAKNDPLPAAIHAPSGQLVQATDQWVGVRRSRIVVCDDSGARAALAAFWLKQLGHEPVVAIIDDALRALPRIASGLPQDGSATRIAAGEALNLIRSGHALTCDLAPSLAYRDRHVAGALWCIRPNIPRLHGIHRPRVILLLGDDASMAELAASDWRDLGVPTVAIVEGGTEALIAAGASTETTPDTPADADAIDHLFFVHDRHDGNLEASRRYLAWETGLIAQLDDRDRAEFTLLTP